MAAKTKEQKLFEQHAKILSDLLKLPGNEICADCSAKGPRWASTNIGIYICIRCSGIHRSLGTHISKVKSTNLDKWAPEQIEYIREIGNIKANQAWEAKLNQAKPNESDTYAVEQFIKEKYVRRRWLDTSLLTPAAREQFEAQTRTSGGGGGYTSGPSGYSHSSGGRDIFGGGSGGGSSGGSSSSSSSRLTPVSRSPPRERHSRHSPPEDSYRSDRRGSSSSSSGSSSRSGERSKRRTRDEHSSSSSHAPSTTPTPAPTPAAPSQPLVQFDAPVAATTTAPPIDAFGAFVSAQSTPAGDFFGATQTGNEFFGTQAPKKATKDDIMSLFESAPTQPAIASPSSQFGAQVYQHAQSLPTAYVAPQYYAATGATMVPATAYVAVRPQGYGAGAPATAVQYGYVQPTYVSAPTAYGVPSTTPQYGGYR